MRRGVNVESVIKPLADYPHQVYISNTIQVADILEYVLKLTGKSVVYMTTFSISEEFLRRLYFIRKGGLISDVEIIMDFKATQKTLILWPFISQTVERCFLADNHSKLLIVVGEHNQCAVVMSQNLTRGNRFECGSITTDHSAVNDLITQFAFIRDNKSVPFNEVFRRRIKAD